MFTTIHSLVGVAYQPLIPASVLGANHAKFNCEARKPSMWIGESSIVYTMVEWQKGLQQKGLYYEGIIDGSRLDSVLELHRRSTVSTFGTRRSSLVSTAQPEKLTMRM